MLKRLMRKMKTIACPKCKGSGALPDPRDEGAQFRQRRMEAGLNLTRMAEAMGISAPYLSDLENGNRAWTDGMRTLFDSAMKTANVKSA